MTNWGFIGAGHIAVKTAREMQLNSQDRIYGVFNRTKERSLSFAEEFGAKVYDDVEAMLLDPNIDIVYIALTNEQHYPYALRAIQANKPFLCEKPFTGNKKEAQAIVEEAKKHRLFAAEAMWTWFNPIAKKTKEAVGRLGKIQSVEYVFHPNMGDYKKITRLVEPSLYGGGLLDLGVYPVRYIYELFGMPKQIKATGELYNGVDKNVDIYFLYEGFEAHILVAIDKKDGEFLTIKGEKGHIEIPDAHMAKEAHYSINGEEEVIFDEEKKYGRMFASVSSSLREGKEESEISLSSTLEVMELLDEIRAQVGVIYSCD